MSQFPPNFHRSSRYWRAGPVESENTCGNIPVCLCLTLQRFSSTFSSRSAVSVLSSAGLENKNMWRVFFVQKTKKNSWKLVRLFWKRKKKFSDMRFSAVVLYLPRTRWVLNGFRGDPKSRDIHTVWAGTEPGKCWQFISLLMCVCVFCSLLLIHVCTRQSFIAHTSVAVVGICFSIFGWNGCGRVGGINVSHVKLDLYFLQLNDVFQSSRAGLWHPAGCCKLVFCSSKFEKGNENRANSWYYWFRLEGSKKCLVLSAPGSYWKVS